MSNELRPKRIDQMLPTFSRQDAIGNHVTEIRRLLRQYGFESDIYSEFFNPTTRDEFRHYSSYRYPARNSIVLYHHSISSNIVNFFQARSYHTIVVYHNVTPPECMLQAKSMALYAMCKKGLSQVGELRGFAQDAWADSCYNMRDLVDAGFTNPKLVPIFRHYDQLRWHPQDTRISRIKSARPIILLVARLCANKGQFDLIKLLKAYYDVYPERPRLLLLGHGEREDFRQARELCLACDLVIADSLDADKTDKADVIVTGAVPDGCLATAYRIADLFLSFSDHEGFGVPLIEAMNFGIPVLAHAAAAVPETVGEGAIIVDKNRPEAVLPLVRRLLHDPLLRAERVKAGHQRAQRFAFNRLEHDFRGLVKNTISAVSGIPIVDRRVVFPSIPGF